MKSMELTEEEKKLLNQEELKLSVYAVTKILEETEKDINAARKQLKALENGEVDMSIMKIASVENLLEDGKNKKDIYQKYYDNIPKKEIDNWANVKEFQEMLLKQSYYKLQKIRLKRKKNVADNIKIEAMLLLDEITDNEEIKYEDEYLIEMAEYIIKNEIRPAVELKDFFNEVKEKMKNEINKLVKDGAELKFLAFFNVYIPIIITYITIFKEEVNNKIEEYNESIIDDNDKEKKNQFYYYKYEDWWFEELFLNHQAYYSLYKWKENIKRKCLDEYQKEVWEKLFNSWVTIRKTLNNKDENGFFYLYVFDKLLYEYADIKEEVNLEEQELMEEEINNSLTKENLLEMNYKHHLITEYSMWKKELEKD